METIQNITEKTRIVITHDIYPGLMDSFDAVLILKLAEAGTFTDLMAKQSVCCHLVNKHIS